MGKFKIGPLIAGIFLLFRVIAFAQSSFNYTNPPPGQPAFPRVGIMNPPAPVLSGSGTTGGSTTYTYTVVGYGHDVNVNPVRTLLGAVATTTTGQTVLSSGTPIVLTTQQDPSAFQYDFLKLVSGVWKSICLAVPATTWQANGVVCTDSGQTPAAYVLPQTNATVDLVTPEVDFGSWGGNLNFTGAVGITGSQKNGKDFIKAVNWNDIVDVRAFGCHGDINPQPGNTPITVVATNGSATVTSTSNPWTAADVGKLINVFDETQFFEIFSGTISAFNSAGSITVSSPISATNGNSFQAEWATADDACWTAMTAAIQSGTPLGGFHIIQSVPMAISQPMLALKWNGVFEGFGCAKSPIIWFGATPDEDMLTMAGNTDTTYRNLCIEGGSFAPPRSGIQLRQRASLSDPPNIRNHIIDTAVGGEGTLFSNLPLDNGQGFVGTPNADIIAGATSITLSSAPPFNGPGPDQALEIVDTSAGATQGNELVMTSHSYVRGASPITLAAGVNRLHSQGNTGILISQPAINNCYFWDSQSTQNDKNSIDHSSARYCNADFMNDGGQGTGTGMHADSGQASLVGFYNISGPATLDAMEWEAVAVEYAIGNSAEVVVSGDNGPQVGGSGTYGPGYRFTQQGGILKLIDVPGFVNLAQFACIGCTVDITSQANKNDDFIDTGSASTMALQFLNTKFTFEANAPASPPFYPSIHTYGGGALARDVLFQYQPAGIPWAHVVVTDPGTSDNRSLRHYRICRQPAVIGDLATPCSDITYRGSEAAADTPGELDFPGLVKTRGAIDVEALDATQAIAAANCTGANTGGATDYWYHYAWSVSDGEGNNILQAANATGSKLSCVNAPSSVNPVKITANEVRGGMVLHLYRASCADPCADPMNELEVATQTVGNTSGAGLGMDTINDVGTAGGAAMPVVDSTGVLTVAGNLHRTAVLVANLPSPCNLGDTRVVSNWNGVNGMCTGGGSGVVTAVCGSANNWSCP